MASAAQFRQLSLKLPDEERSAFGIIQDALNAGRRSFEIEWLTSSEGTAIASTASRRLAAGVPGAEGVGIEHRERHLYR